MIWVDRMVYSVGDMLRFSTKGPSRTPCRYGEACYRKDPRHKERSLGWMKHVRLFPSFHLYRP